MVYAPHIRMTMLGRLGNTAPGVERFSTGLAIADTVGALTPSVQDLESFLPDVVADVVAFWGSLGCGISPAAVLESVKFANIGADGKYLNDPLEFAAEDAEAGVGVEGGGPATVLYPPQTSRVVSLGTAAPLNRVKGRVYLPLPGVSLDSGFATSVADAQALEVSFAQLITDINNEPGFDTANLNVVVASTKGANWRVTEVRCGRVLDTMRSRRRSIPEDYSAATLIP